MRADCIEGGLKPALNVLVHSINGAAGIETAASREAINPEIHDIDALLRKLRLPQIGNRPLNYEFMRKGSSGGAD